MTDSLSLASLLTVLRFAKKPGLLSTCLSHPSGAVDHLISPSHTKLLLVRKLPILLTGFDSFVSSEE